MKALRIVLLLAGVIGLFTIVVFGIRAVSNPARQSEDASALQPSAETRKSTPADPRIRAGESQIKIGPAKPDGYNLLASAYMQKARETGDFSFNARAEEALNQSLRVAPDNYDALKLRSKLFLTFHRFREALAEAQRAQGLRPEDHDVYGALTDAYVELGEYERGVESAQRMVDLRPDAASYSRVAYLRSLHGDTEGAIEAMQVAVKAADPRDPEGVAWYRVHLGDELMLAGRLAEAEREYDKALVVFPGYSMALAAKARARSAAGDYDVAVEIYERDSSHDALLALGDLYTKLGRADEAERMYKAFEAAEREVAVEENDMSHLARFWADRGQNLDEALDVMQSERTKRADIYTCDGLAWTLFKKGRLAEAKAAIDEALRLGTRDARISYHAGVIYNAVGERRKAAHYLQLALDIDPSFDVLHADAARQTLSTIKFL
ncbi:MAG: tetratricopeptide repeat protein [Acidobacteria bacterium]|nr:tetratricopeptide repeat protein [Acidobacteriota bacterium]